MGLATSSSWVSRSSPADYVIFLRRRTPSCATGSTRPSAPPSKTAPSRRSTTGTACGTMTRTRLAEVARIWPPSEDVSKEGLLDYGLILGLSTSPPWNSPSWRCRWRSWSGCCCGRPAVRPALAGLAAVRLRRAAARHAAADAAVRDLLPAAAHRHLHSTCAFWAGVLGLAINYSAYEAENYRAGLLAIPRGQMEAALSLGMSTWTALRRVDHPAGGSHRHPAGHQRLHRPVQGHLRVQRDRRDRADGADPPGGATGTFRGLMVNHPQLRGPAGADDGRAVPADELSRCRLLARRLERRFSPVAA